MHKQATEKSVKRGRGRPVTTGPQVVLSNFHASPNLIQKLNELAEHRNCNRSKLIRDAIIQVYEKELAE